MKDAVVHKLTATVWLHGLKTETSPSELNFQTRASIPSSLFVVGLRMKIKWFPLATPFSALYQIQTHNERINECTVYDFINLFCQNHYLLNFIHTRLLVVKLFFMGDTV